MFYVIVILTAIFAMPAKGDETVKWRKVQHQTSWQLQQPGDVEGHFLGLFHMVGIAFFPDGSTGTTSAFGTFDSVTSAGGGTTNGYENIVFSDGSELWFKYTGEFKYGNPKVANKGTAIVIGGKGRYAGAKGDATYAGENTRPGPEAIGYLDYVVNIKK
jgi:hypothetical protein